MLIRAIIAVVHQPEEGSPMNTYNPHFHRNLRNERADTSPRVDTTRLGVRTLNSASLFERGENEIGIAPGESLYRLKITRQGKLILNK